MFGVCFPEMSFTILSITPRQRSDLEVAATRARDEGLHQGEHVAMTVRLFIKIDVSGTNCILLFIFLFFSDDFILMEGVGLVRANKRVDRTGTAQQSNLKT